MFPCEGTATVNARPAVGPVPVSGGSKTSLQNQILCQDQNDIRNHDSMFRCSYVSSPNRHQLVGNNDLNGRKNQCVSKTKSTWLHKTLSFNKHTDKCSRPLVFFSLEIRRGRNPIDTAQSLSPK